MLFCTISVVTFLNQVHVIVSVERNALSFSSVVPALEHKFYSCKPSSSERKAEVLSVPVVDFPHAWSLCFIWATHCHRDINSCLRMAWLYCIPTTEKLWNTRDFFFWVGWQKSEWNHHARNASKWYTNPLFCGSSHYNRNSKNTKIPNWTEWMNV